MALVAAGQPKQVFNLVFVKDAVAIVPTLNDPHEAGHHDAKGRDGAEGRQAQSGR